MDVQIKNRLRKILAECQMRVNQIANGYKVVLVKAEPTKSEIEADVEKALQDREAAGGIGADDHPQFVAPLTLDGVSKSDRELIERAVEESRSIEGLEK